MERFHYTIQQKLTILELVRTGQIMRLATQFPQVTQKQIDDWKEKEEEMKAIPGLERSTKFALHKGPKTKYKELYQVLYQTVKELRFEKKSVTVELLIEVAKAECPTVSTLSSKGQTSLICRFMEQFNLSIREITGTSGFREEQASETQKEEIGSFIRHFKQTVVQKSISIESIFNMDQTGFSMKIPPQEQLTLLVNVRFQFKPRAERKNV